MSQEACWLAQVRGFSVSTRQSEADLNPRMRRRSQHGSRGLCVLFRVNADVITLYCKGSPTQVWFFR